MRIAVGAAVPCLPVPRSSVTFGHGAVTGDGMGLLQASPVGYQNTLCRIVHAVLIHVMEEGTPPPDQGPEPDEIVQ